MRNPTLIIEKTLGKLREVCMTNDLLKVREDAILRFSAEKETLRIWQNYGQYNLRKSFILGFPFSFKQNTSFYAN